MLSAYAITNALKLSSKVIKIFIMSKPARINYVALNAIAGMLSALVTFSATYDVFLSVIERLYYGLRSNDLSVRNVAVFARRRFTS